MEREYQHGVIRDNVDMFIGTEVEHTPVHGKKTLFVTGMHKPSYVLDEALRNECSHVYLGANQSFQLGSIYGNEKEQNSWDDLVSTLLKSDLWVTLDYDLKYHDFVLESGYNENDRFISMISVKLPYIDQLNYNACLKVDDIDFRKSNTGVWVHRVHDLKALDKYTDWSYYTNDKPL